MIVIPAGQLIQSVIDTHPDERDFRLEAGTYEGAVRLTRASPISLWGTGATKAVLTSRAPSTITLAGALATLMQLEVRNQNTDGTIVTDVGVRNTLDHCDLFGDANTGQHRGIAANGQGLYLNTCRVDECWKVGQDAQALCGWDGTADLLAEDCYFGGGAQSVMFGGADPMNDDRTPTNITLRRCQFSKNPAWFGKKAQIKCAVELKNARNVWISDYRVEYAGVSQGQGAYLFVVTPRNQGGKAPWSTVSNVLIERGLGGFAGGVASFLGQDDTPDRPSGPCHNVTLRDLNVTNIDPTGWTKGAGRILSFSNGPQSITVERLVVMGDHLKAAAYFIGKPPTGLVLRDLQLPPTTYGYKIDNGGSGPEALRGYAPGAILERI